MAEFGAAATLSVEVPDSELRAARAEIEDELGDLTVSVEASQGGPGAPRGGGVPLSDGGMDVPTQLSEQTALLDDIEEHLELLTRGGGGGGVGGGGDGGGLTILPGGGGGLLGRLPKGAMLAGGGASIGLTAMLAGGGQLTEGDMEAIENEPSGNFLGIEPGSQSHLLEEPEWLANIEERSEVLSNTAAPDWLETWGEVQGVPQPDRSRVPDTQPSDAGSGGRKPADPDAVREVTRRDPGSGASIRERSNGPAIVVEDNTTVNVDAVRELERALDRKKDDIARDVMRRLDQRFDRGLQR